MWVRVVLGLAGLGAFWVLAVGDARALHAEADVPRRWTLLATGATVLAGYVHLALTPEHWEESTLYGLFFLVAGLVQLLLASMLARPGTGVRIWATATAVNVVLIAVYVATRLLPPPGAERPEALDSLGLVTVAAETVAAAVSVVIMRRRLRHPADVRPRPPR